MSLDVYLEMPDVSKPQASGIFVRENGSTREISKAEWDEKFPGLEPVVAEQELQDNCAFEGNITHNLNRMADEAAIYMCLWRPEELNITMAQQLIEPLENGLTLLRSDPERFKALNPANGWGDYEGLVQFIEDYLKACKAFPEATVRVWR